MEGLVPWEAKKNGRLFKMICSRLCGGEGMREASNSSCRECSSQKAHAPSTFWDRPGKTAEVLVFQKHTFIKSHTEALLLVRQTHRYIWTMTELAIFIIFASYLSFFKLHHLTRATPVSMSSWFCSPGSPGNQVLRNNHLINSSSHQQCLPSFTHQHTMGEFTY